MSHHRSFAYNIKGKVEKKMQKALFLKTPKKTAPFVYFFAK
jgi:hypothetical protein